MIGQIRFQVTAGIIGVCPWVTDLIVILRAIRLIEAVVAVERGHRDFRDRIVHNATARLTECLNHGTIRYSDVRTIRIICVIGAVIRVDIPVHAVVVSGAISITDGITYRLCWTLHMREVPVYEGVVAHEGVHVDGRILGDGDELGESVVVGHLYGDGLGGVGTVVHVVGETYLSGCGGIVELIAVRRQLGKVICREGMVRHLPRCLIGVVFHLRDLGVLGKCRAARVAQRGGGGVVEHHARGVHHEVGVAVEVARHVFLCVHLHLSPWLYAVAARRDVDGRGVVGAAHRLYLHVHAVEVVALQLSREHVGVHLIVGDLRRAIGVAARARVALAPRDGDDEGRHVCVGLLPAEGVAVERRVRVVVVNGVPRHGGILMHIHLHGVVEAGVRVRGVLAVEGVIHQSVVEHDAHVASVRLPHGEAGAVVAPNVQRVGHVEVNLQLGGNACHGYGASGHAVLEFYGGERLGVALHDEVPLCELGPEVMAEHAQSQRVEACRGRG